VREGAVTDDGKELCQRCGASGYDRRTLWMACLYEMDELGLPFVHAQAGDGRRFYTLLVCKQCRGSWMGAIKQWFRSQTRPDE